MARDRRSRQRPNTFAQTKPPSSIFRLQIRGGPYIPIWFDPFLNSHRFDEVVPLLLIPFLSIEETLDQIGGFESVQSALHLPDPSESDDLCVHRLVTSLQSNSFRGVPSTHLRRAITVCSVSKGALCSTRALFRRCRRRDRNCSQWSWA